MWTVRRSKRLVFFFFRILIVWANYGSKLVIVYVSMSKCSIKMYRNLLVSLSPLFHIWRYGFGVEVAVAAIPPISKNPTPAEGETCEPIEYHQAVWHGQYAERTSRT